jgi:long-chain acyl-CoA synthetase
MSVVFITGATGQLGRAIVRRFLQTDNSLKLKLLVRASSDEVLQQRVDRLLEQLGFNSCDIGMRERIEGIRGDVGMPKLGIPDEDYNDLARTVQGIIHLAACTRWDLPLEDLRNINTAGTRHVAQLALRATQENGLEYFAHVSTAYVAGDRRGLIRETELSEGQAFNNNYERSKFESEVFIQDVKNDIPIIVFRPSMIIGDSTTGETTNFNVFYYLVKMAVKGRLKALPTMRSALIDLVPSDYAAAAIYETIKQENSKGKTFHLCSGSDRTPTMKEIFELMTRFFSKYPPANGENLFRCPMMIHPALYRNFISPFLRLALSAERKQRLRNVEVYVPYTSATKLFDTSHTTAALKDVGLSPPLFQDYYKNIFQYCLDTDWGKKNPGAPSQNGRRRHQCIVREDWQPKRLSTHA